MQTHLCAEALVHLGKSTVSTTSVSFVLQRLASPRPWPCNHIPKLCAPPTYLCRGGRRGGRHLFPVFTLRVQTLDLAPQTVYQVLRRDDVIKVVFVSSQSQPCNPRTNQCYQYGFFTSEKFYFEKGLCVLQLSHKEETRLACHKVPRKRTNVPNC